MWNISGCKKAILVCLLALIWVSGGSAEASEKGAQSGYFQNTLKIAIDPIEGNLDPNLRKRLRIQLLDTMSLYRQLTVYTHKELVDEVSWRRSKGKLECSMPEDCRAVLMEDLGIRQSVRLEFSPRKDGWIVMRLRIMAPGQNREYTEALPEEAAAPVVLEKSLPSLLGYEAQLQKEEGVLRISSQPLAAKVYMQGVLLGETPLNLHSKVGANLPLRLSLEGVGELSRVVSVPKKYIGYNDFDLVAHRGELLVDSVPSGAKILLDGNAVGETPLVLKDVVEGEHVVSFSLPPYDQVERIVDVPAEDLLRVKHLFAADLAHLEVIPQNARGVEIYINGEMVSEGIYKTDLPGGTYKIDIFKSGFVTYRRTVHLKSGDRVQIKPDFEEGLSLRPGERIVRKLDYRPAIFTTLASSLALGFGIFLELEAQSHYDKSTNYVKGTSVYDQEREDGRNSRIGGGVLMGVGSAGLLAGVALFIWAPDKEVVIVPETDGKSVALIKTTFKF